MGGGIAPMLNMPVIDRPQSERDGFALMARWLKAGEGDPGFGEAYFEYDRRLKGSIGDVLAVVVSSSRSHCPCRHPFEARESWPTVLASRRLFVGRIEPGGFVSCDEAAMFQFPTKEFHYLETGSEPLEQRKPASVANRKESLTSMGGMWRYFGLPWEGPFCVPPNTAVSIGVGVGYDQVRDWLRRAGLFSEFQCLHRVLF